MRKKILIIRFSSFGDIFHGLCVVPSLRKLGYEIHWLVRSDFKDLLTIAPIDKVHSFDRKDGLLGLFRLGQRLKRLRFNAVYDAHNNLRSNILKWYAFAPWSRIFRGTKFIQRSKFRFKRFLLFKLRINKFPSPYKAMSSFLSPLKSLGVDQEYKGSEIFSVSDEVIKSTKLKLASEDKLNRIILAPSAAWEMKTWPIDNWNKLIELMPDHKFYIIGGPSDKFCQEFEKNFSDRVVNLAGKLSLLESVALINISPLLICADTGVLHVADLFSKSTIALMGPTAFGFTSTNAIETLSVDLKCRPCTKDGRGKCTQDIYQKCMVQIDPELVAKKANELFPASI